MNHIEALACVLAGVEDLNLVSDYDLEAAKDIWHGLARMGFRSRLAHNTEETTT